MDWDLLVVIAIIAAGVILALALKVLIFLFAKKGIGNLTKPKKDKYKKP